MAISWPSCSRTRRASCARLRLLLWAFKLEETMAIMARAADAAGIQFRILNSRKGAAVRATRAQAGDFLSLCYNPDLAAEVTLMILRVFVFITKHWNDRIILPSGVAKFGTIHG